MLGRFLNLSGLLSLLQSSSSTDDSDSVSSYTLTRRFVGSISHSLNAFAILSFSWYFPESKMSSSSTNRTASLFCFAISRAARLEAEGPAPQVFAPALFCLHCFPAICCPQYLPKQLLLKRCCKFLCEHSWH